MQPHIESTVGQPSGLLGLVGELQRHSCQKLTTLNDGVTEPLWSLISDGDDEKMRREMSFGEIILLFNLRIKQCSITNFCRNSQTETWIEIGHNS